MIQIYINGCELAIYRDTTLNIEYNNALFSQDSMDGDVAYAFDIPVQGNERALNFEHLPYSVSHRKYDCSINVGGINIITGKLVVQKVTDKKYSVAVIVNPYPEGWADRSVRDDYNEETVIANSYPTHKIDWKNFLARTVNEQSDVKFGVFANDENYGSNNEDFGNWNGAVLEKLVNRLFFTTSGNVVEIQDHPLIRLFNQKNSFENGSVEMNQFAFCPQFRLSSILRKVIASSGYVVDGSFFEDEKLKRIYLQSMVALDGEVYQYLDTSNIRLSSYYEAFGDPRYQYPVYVWRDQYGCWYYDYEGMDVWAEGFGSIYGQQRISSYPIWGLYDEEIRYIPLTQSEGEYITCHYGHIVFSAAGRYHVNIRIQFPRFISTSFVKKIPVKIRFKNGQGETKFEHQFNISEGNWSVMFRDDLTISEGDVGESFHLSAELEIEGVSRSIPAEGRIYISFKGYNEEPSLNIFSKSYHENRCLPEIDNSKFINEIRKALGLTFYVDSRSKEIEVDTVSDIMRSGALDLSDYVLTNETVLDTKDRATSFAFSQLNSSNDISEDKLIEDVLEMDGLPPADQNCGRICLVKCMNQYYISDKEEDAISNWIYSWKPYCGNTKEIRVGDSKPEEISSSVVIPMLREYEVKNSFGERGTIPDIPASIESVMFDSKPSDKIILLYYRGQENLKARERTFRYECMSPYVNNEFSLSQESLGDQFTKKWLKIYSSERTISYKFRMPIAVALRTISLLQPQRVSPSNQVRWLMVDNVRTMPKKISFQIDNNDALVLCEIEAAKPD